MLVKCRVCKIEKTEEHYRMFRGRKNKTCNGCRDKNNNWYLQDLGGKRTKAKEYYKSKKSLIAQYRSDLRLNRKYSLTREEWTKMLESQNGQCLICKISFEEVKPCVDHDHKSGKVRALLCRRCNLDLQVLENTNFVQQATIYLKSMK